jgi:hypothetical protein
MPAWVYFIAALVLIGVLVDWRARRKRKGLNRMVGNQSVDNPVARATNVDPIGTASIPNMPQNMTHS